MTRICKRGDDDDDDEIAYFIVCWKTRKLVLVYRTKTKNWNDDGK